MELSAGHAGALKRVTRGFAVGTTTGVLAVTSGVTSKMNGDRVCLARVKILSHHLDLVVTLDAGGHPRERLRSPGAVTQSAGIEVSANDKAGPGRPC